MNYRDCKLACRNSDHKYNYVEKVDCGDGVDFRVSVASFLGDRGGFVVQGHNSVLIPCDIMR